MGYIGPTVVRHLRKAYPDAFLVGFDIGYFSNCLTTVGTAPECLLDVQFFGDMRVFPDYILNGIDGIIHLAAISNDPIGNTFEKVTFDINYHSSIELAKKAKANGVKKFVFASSCAMYGSADDSPKVETDSLNPLTAYAKSKVYTERGLKPLSGQEFVVTCLRFSTACGMSDRLRLDLVLNDFVAGAVSEKKISILSDGKPWRPLINVNDMARAIDWGLTREVANGGQFLCVNVGTDEWNCQVKDLAEAVAEVIPNTEISINKDAQPDKRSYRVNFELFKNLAPNHQPKINLVETVQELKRGLESISFNDVKFRSSNNMRLKMLTHLREMNLLDEKLCWVV